MADSPLLAIILLLPLAGTAAVALLGLRAARGLTLALMLAELALALAIFAGFDGSAGPTLQRPLIDALGISLHFGVDGFNLYLLLLTALLFPVVLGCRWAAEESQSRLYLALLLALQACLLGTFLAQDLVVFFVFWEAVLIPMLLLVLVFGGAQRRQAALTFFLYTMAGSVLLLAAVLLLGAAHLDQYGRWAFGFDALATVHLSPGQQTFVFFAVVLACAIKSPLVPFHAWLPPAYGTASPTGAALMAGLMSKMGAFGLIKLALPLAPDAAVQWAPLMALLAVTSILYGAVLALRQPAWKPVIAYASLSHMGFIVLGIFSFQQSAAHGALLQILSHGVTVAGLFLLLGLLDDRSRVDRQPEGALAQRAPRLAVVAMLLVLASLALPLTSGFAAEFMVLLGAFTEGLSAWRAGDGVLRLALAVAATFAVVLGAAYMLRLARALVFGTGIETRALMIDLRPREALALAPLLVLVLAAGIAPAMLMSKVQPAAAALASYGHDWKLGRATWAAVPTPSAAARQAAGGAPHPLPPVTTPAMPGPRGFHAK